MNQTESGRVSVGDEVMLCPFSCSFRNAGIAKKIFVKAYGIVTACHAGGKVDATFTYVQNDRRKEIHWQFCERDLFVRPADWASGLYR